MRTVADPPQLRRLIAEARRSGLRIGFVPTMGSLHEGHLSLMRHSRGQCGFTVAGIFVNPIQFGPGEDFERYPRTMERDSKMLDAEEVDLLFAPESSSIYPSGFATHVEVAGPATGLCAPFRPGHFRGVATIVAKLFNIVRPDAAYFGQKDAQQAAVIRRMTADLDFDVQIVVCPTVREHDGLAMSSRNAYLSAEERLVAPVLYAALNDARRAIRLGERSAFKVTEIVRQRLVEAAFKIEYIEVVGGPDLQPRDPLSGEILLAVGARLGATRLIDNIVIEIPR